MGLQSDCWKADEFPSKMLGWMVGGNACVRLRVYCLTASIMFGMLFCGMFSGFKRCNLLQGLD